VLYAAGYGRAEMKCSVYVGASLDGFIAKPGGDLEWLHNPAYSSPDELGMNYESFISTVDDVVMGRNTFEKVLSFKLPNWPYDIPVTVLSGRPMDVPEHLKGKVTVDGGSPDEIVGRLAKAGRSHLYIDGGLTVQRFLHAGLIDEITITWIPILLGSGIPLFASNGVETSLKLIEISSTQGGLVQTRYRTERGI
jgi:dihydrofolate reductase